MQGTGDTDEAKLELPKDMLIEMDVGDDTSSTFSSSYLAMMAKAMYMESFTLHLKQDSPLKVTHSDEDMDLEYYVAPRIKD